MDERNRNQPTQSPPKHGEDMMQRSRLDEEYAAELNADVADERRDEEVISMYGWIGIGLAVLSLFMWPLILSLAAIVLGFVSRAKGAQVLGNVAITVGVFSIILRFLIMPFV